MFTFFRSVVIIGLIFYFSPERDRKELKQHPVPRGQDAESAETARAQDETTANEVLTSVVGSLAQEVARAAAKDLGRTVVKDKAQEAGLRLKEQVAWSEPSPRSAMPLISAEREAAARANSNASIRCVYRCDGKE